MSSHLVTLAGNCNNKIITVTVDHHAAEIIQFFKNIAHNCNQHL